MNRLPVADFGSGRFFDFIDDIYDWMDKLGDKHKAAMDKFSHSEPLSFSEILNTEWWKF